MALMIRLKQNHRYPSTLLLDPKMMVTKEWKSISKKTKEIKSIEHWFEFKPFESPKKTEVAAAKAPEKIAKVIKKKAVTKKKGK